MTHELILLHRSGSDRFSFERTEEGAQSWFEFKTCMRHIVIGDSDDVEPLFAALSEGDEVLRGEDAHRFLLQVICGLHSPLLGETEVNGQFKNAVSSFVFNETPAMVRLQRFFKTLFEDAKRVRQAHLEDLGSQSYGSVLRRDLKGYKRVHVLGAGHLVQEILPWIAKDGTEIHVHCRDPKKAIAALGQLVNPDFVHSLESNERLANADALVIAAPVSASWVKGWVADFATPSLVADLRSDSKEDVIEGFASVMALGDLFDRIQGNQVRLQARKNEALAAIDAAVAERSRHVEYRPFGWEDVCA